jgi:hypothetical protein
VAARVEVVPSWDFRVRACGFGDCCSATSSVIILLMSRNSGVSTELTYTKVLVVSFGEFHRAMHCSQNDSGPMDDAATTCGSKYMPDQRRISSRPACSDRGQRCGPASACIVSRVSATLTIREPRGMASPLSPRGYPLPLKSPCANKPFRHSLRRGVTGLELRSLGSSSRAG